MSVAVQAMEKERIGGPAFNSPVLDDANEDGISGNPGTEVRKPGIHDVLLGRGGGTNNHTGNVTFRQLVNKHKMRYLACSKVDKPKVAREVVQLWRKLDPPGRFLQRKDETKKGPGSVKDASNIWIEVGDKKAREKASQCLRERTPDVMPYLSQLRQHQDHMTEKGVSMVQHQLQMAQNNGGNMPARRHSLVGQMPDRPTMTNNVSRRISMPAGGPNTNPIPVTPTSSMPMQARRTSMPAVSQHTLGMQQNNNIMARQQQVLRDAYTVIERSGGNPPPGHVGSMSMMGQQQAMGDRQMMMQQQYGNFDGGPNMMYNNGMMQQNRQQMMQNNSMYQNHSPQMMHHNNMGNNFVSPNNGGRGSMNNFGHRQGMGMHSPNNMMMQQQLAQMPRSMPLHNNNQGGGFPRDIQVSMPASDDLEPLPYGEDDEPLPLDLVPDMPHSSEANHVSPDTQGRLDKFGQGQSSNSQHHSDDAFQKTKPQDQEASKQPASTPNSTTPDASRETTPTGFGDEDFQNLNLDHEDPLMGTTPAAAKTEAPMRRKSALKSSEAGPVAAASEVTLLEYRKTLEDYISNHQIASSPAVDVDDDDISDEGIGVDGIDTTEWIQQALNDSGDFSNIVEKKKGRRGNLERSNSKKSVASGMSVGTSYMSLAFSDMDQSGELDNREKKMGAARSMASNQSLMSELTDFGELDGL